MPETRSGRYSRRNTRLIWFRALCVLFLLDAAVGLFGIASAAYRHAASSPARRWGGAAVLGGVVFIAAAEWDRRRLKE